MSAAVFFVQRPCSAACVGVGYGAQVFGSDAVEFGVGGVPFEDVHQHEAVAEDFGQPFGFNVREGFGGGGFAAAHAQAVGVSGFKFPQLGHDFVFRARPVDVARFVGARAGSAVGVGQPVLAGVAGFDARVHGFDRAEIGGGEEDFGFFGEVAVVEVLDGVHGFFAQVVIAEVGRGCPACNCFQAA